MATVNSLLDRFTGNLPASFEGIGRVQQKLKFPLPKNYTEFMLGRNGGEGFIGRSYLVLWKVGDLNSMNAAHHVDELAPNLFLFGSNGGGKAFGFDMDSEGCAIVSIPFVAMDLEDAKVVAADFDAFLVKLSTP